MEVASVRWVALGDAPDGRKKTFLFQSWSSEVTLWLLTQGCFLYDPLPVCAGPAHAGMNGLV